ncbi:MAG: GGDEF domain-containing protein [Acidimicrobiia bacterium]
MDDGFFARIVDVSPDIVACFDADLRLIYVNRALEEGLGRVREDVIGKQLHDLVVNPTRDALWRPLLSAMLEDGKQRQLEWGYPDVVEGPEFFETRAVAVVDDEGRVTSINTFTRRCTERHDLEQRLSSLAFSDALTGLPTRSLFQTRLEQAVARSARTGSSIAVCFCDLDGFKQINDTLGHLAGDDVLVRASERVHAAVRASDTVARWGGDEFVILVEDTDDEITNTVCSRLVAAVEDHIPAPDGARMHLSASIGVAVATGGSRSPHALLAHADAALYRAKRRGRGSVEISL